MFTLRFAILACTLTLAICSPHYNINKEVDALLVNLNQFLASKNMDTSLIQDLGEDGQPLFVGTIVSDLTTMYRTGDCELWADGDNIKIKMNVGLRKMIVHVLLVPYMNGPGTFSFDGNSAEIELILKPDGAGSCTTDWHHFNITTLGKVISHSFNKEFDGKPAPKELTSIMIPFYNESFNDDEFQMFTLSGLNRLINVCDQKVMHETFRKYHQKM
ncbi:hypothetical protein O3M35_011752 [Rhynocoris fuscipes]|uniref:Secreted protein n=1 Tax=Rhynocoris fuscipes TaxID=488301 RepID=A0AAW1CF51_9HEMI